MSELQALTDLELLEELHRRGRIVGMYEAASYSNWMRQEAERKAAKSSFYEAAAVVRERGLEMPRGFLL